MRRVQSKTGAGVAFEQSLSGDTGVFARLSSHDGKTETYAFTEIDRSTAAGMLMTAIGTVVAAVISGRNNAEIKAVHRTVNSAQTANDEKRASEAHEKQLLAVDLTKLATEKEAQTRAAEQKTIEADKARALLLASTTRQAELEAYVVDLKLQLTAAETARVATVEATRVIAADAATAAAEAARVAVEAGWSRMSSRLDAIERNQIQMSPALIPPVIGSPASPTEATIIQPPDNPVQESPGVRSDDSKQGKA